MNGAGNSYVHHKTVPSSRWRAVCRKAQLTKDDIGLCGISVRANKFMLDKLRVKTGIFSVERFF